ncbi:MAG: hypothetical protein ACK4L4_20090, partial [Gemmobacter sp.]
VAAGEVDLVVAQVAAQLWPALAELPLTSARLSVSAFTTAGEAVALAELASPLRLRLPVTAEVGVGEEHRCMFVDEEAGALSAQGCVRDRAASNVNETQCLCSHATEFTTAAAVVAEVVVTPLEVAVEEGGAAGEVSVSLASHPWAAVTVAVAAASPAQLNVHPATLVIAMDDWASAHSVEVEAVNDRWIEG